MVEARTKEVAEMTNTYQEDNFDHVDENTIWMIKEELRCIRCVLERLLRHYAPEEFVDYQMEKFGKAKE